MAVVCTLGIVLCDGTGGYVVCVLLPLVSLPAVGVTTPTEDFIKCPDPDADDDDEVLVESSVSCCTFVDAGNAIKLVIVTELAATIDVKLVGVGELELIRSPSLLFVSTLSLLVPELGHTDE